MGILLALGAAYVPLAGSVSKTLTPSDAEAVATLKADHVCSNLDSFERQLACVRFVQLAVQNYVPDMRCTEFGDQIEPLDSLERVHGCCFDRSRFIEKALEHYGMATRRVAMHDRSRHGILAYAVPGIRSHATAEVYTAKGWMAVDSNEPFILLTKDGRPITYEELDSTPREQLLEQPIPNDLFVLPMQITYGLYSRHGLFHGPDLPAPEINYPDFIRYNFGGAERPAPKRDKVDTGPNSANGPQS